MPIINKTRLAVYDLLYKNILCEKSHNNKLEILVSGNFEKISLEVQNALVIYNWVPADKILSARMEVNLLPLLKITYENSFSHIPTLDENRRLVGILGRKIFE